MKHYFFTALTTICLLLTACGGDNESTDGNGMEVKPARIDPQTLENDYVFTLPVIFHVLYTNPDDATQYVSASRLKHILDNVNNLYAGSLYGSSEPINVTFALATEDEEGHKLTTPGVEYIRWEGSYPIDADDLMTNNTQRYTRYIWDPNKYINVMLYHFKTQDNASGTVLGVSHMPYTVKGEHALAGLDTVEVAQISKSALRFAYCLSINSRYINDESSRYTTNPDSDHGIYMATDVNVTLAHELGHYLGLHHVFAEYAQQQTLGYANDCFDSDYCEDTPSYNRQAYESEIAQYLAQLSIQESPSFDRLIRRTRCDGTSFNSDNLMDYSISESFRFSKDQKKRIRNVLLYSPLIPGIKYNSNPSSRSEIADQPMNLPIRYVK